MPTQLIEYGAVLACRGGDLSPRQIEHEVVVPIDPTTAFRLWTSDSGVRAWLVSDSAVVLEPGGPFELYFLADGPTGSRGSEGCKVTSFVPDRMLSFTWNAPPHLERTRNQRTWVVVDFEPVAEGTRLRLTHLGWPERAWDAEPQWAETFEYFRNAWGRVLAVFADHAASIAT